MVGHEIRLRARSDFQSISVLNTLRQQGLPNQNFLML